MHRFHTHFRIAITLQTKKILPIFIACVALHSAAARTDLDENVLSTTSWNCAGSEILQINAEKLIAATCTQTSDAGLETGKAVITLKPGQLFDKIEGKVRNGKLDGEVRLYPILDPMTTFRPNLFCTPPKAPKVCNAPLCPPDLGDCIELEHPRPTYFQGLAQSGKISGNLMLLHFGRIVADIRPGDNPASPATATVYLYHPEAPHIPTRRFSGSISKDWALVGTWDDIPWSLQVGDYSLDVVGNQAVAVNDKGYLIAGGFGQASAAMTSYRLLDKAVPSPSYTDDRYLIEKDYSDSSMGSFKIKESSKGTFHGRVLARTSDGIAYEGRFSPSIGAVIDEIIVMGENGQRHPGWIKDGQIFWRTTVERKNAIGKIGREIKRIWDKDVEANARRGWNGFCDFVGVQRENCHFNFGATVGSDGKVTIMNNKDYVAPKTESETIRDLTALQLQRIEQDFTASTLTGNGRILGESIIAEARMYAFLAKSSRLNAADLTFLKAGIENARQAYDRLNLDTSLSANLEFEIVDFHNKRLMKTGGIYRTPAGIVGTGSSFFAWFQAADTWSQLYDDADKVYDLRKFPGLNSTQYRLIDRAGLKFQKLTAQQLAGQTSAEAAAIYGTLIMLPFPEIPDLVKDRQIRILLKAIDNIGDAKEFLRRYPEIRSEREYYLRISEFIRNQLAEQLEKSSNSPKKFSPLLN